MNTHAPPNLTNHQQELFEILASADRGLTLDQLMVLVQSPTARHQSVPQFPVLRSVAPSDSPRRDSHDRLGSCSEAADVHGRLREQLRRLKFAESSELRIGTAKEVLETTIATIHELMGGERFSSKDSLHNRARNVMRLLGIFRPGLDNARELHDSHDRAVRAVVTIVNHLGTVRNSRGTGHGHSAFVPMIERHHADYFVQLGVSTAQWLWECYEVALGRTEYSSKLHAH